MKKRQWIELFTFSIVNLMTTNLRACFDNLDANKTTGLDGVKKHEYHQNLEANLQDLPNRFKREGFSSRSQKEYLFSQAIVKNRVTILSLLQDISVKTVLIETSVKCKKRDFSTLSVG